MEATNSTESPTRYIVVLKIGGNELDDEAFIFGLVKAVKAVQEEGHFPVIVHGGGKAVTDYGKKLGLEEKRIDGTMARSMSKRCGIPPAIWDVSAK